MRGHFGIGVYNPKHSVNVGGIWRSAGCFGADWMFTIGKRIRRQPSDTRQQFRHTPMFEFEDFDDFRKHVPFGTKIIAIELAPDSHILTNFVHPERAVYLLGAEDNGLPKSVLEKCHQVIEIPAPSLNVASAASIVLYDRFSKDSRSMRVAI